MLRHNSLWFARFLTLAVTISAFVVPALAQVGRSGLEVTAINDAGQPLANVEFTLRPAEDTTSREQAVKTDRRGRFASRFLSSGRYVIAVKDTDKYFIKDATVEIKDSGGILLASYEIVAHPFDGLTALPIQGGQITSVRIVVTDAAYGDRLRRQVESGSVQNEVAQLLAHYNAREFEQAAALGERLMQETTTELPEVLQLTAMSKAQLGRREDAKMLLMRAIEIAPDQPELKANLGTVLLEAARETRNSGTDATAAFSEAETWLQRAVDEMDPPPTALLINLSIAMEGAGRLEGAVTVMERIIAEDPSSLAIQFRLAAVLRRLGQPDRALQVLNSVPETAADPRAVDILFNIGLTFYNEGDYDSAQAALARAEAMDPKHGLVQRLIGRTYYAQGQSAKAIPYLQRFLEMEPDHPEAELEREMIKYLKQTTGQKR